MTRVGFVLKVKEERIEAYKEEHRSVWPEMLAALREAGWRNYSLFMAADGTLFGYFETPDSLAAAQAAMERTEVNARWQERMAPFFESPDGAHPDRMLVELEEVFHLE
jgi:L-rhamnose mutarotase